jgi:TonB family protein
MAHEKKQKHFLNHPVYPGGQKALTEFIYGQLRYPAAAFEAGVEGIVLVEYDIDYQGKVVDTRVIQSVGHGCDEEACRVVRLLRFEVKKNRGVRVLFHQKARIQFKKPVPPPPVALPPTAPQQVTYTITFTPAPPTAAPDGDAPAEPPTYGYTITLGG